MLEARTAEPPSTCKEKYLSKKPVQMLKPRWMDGDGYRVSVCFRIGAAIPSGHMYLYIAPSHYLIHPIGWGGGGVPLGGNPLFPIFLSTEYNSVCLCD